jgi:hypothetical protein
MQISSSLPCDVPPRRAMSINLEIASAGQGWKSRGNPPLSLLPDAGSWFAACMVSRDSDLYHIHNQLEIHAYYPFLSESIGFKFQSLIPPCCMLKIVLGLNGFKIRRIRIGRRLASYSESCGFGGRLGGQQPWLLSVTPGKFRKSTYILPIHDTNRLNVRRCLVYLLIAFK